MNEEKLEALTLFFKALADETRLRLVSLLLEEPRTVQELAGRLKVTAPTVSHHLKRLDRAGLVSCTARGHHHVYRLRLDLLREMSNSLLREAPDEVRPKTPQSKILADFMVDGRLKTIPAQRKKRRVVLEHILSRFEEDRSYPEREVNAILKRFHDDVATLRREMILNKLMDRQDSVYRRIDVGTG